MPLAPTRHMTTDTMFTASTQTLKFMAAALWLSGGIVLVYKGSAMLLAAQALQAGTAWPAIVLGLGIGWLKVHFMFRNSCRKNLSRITQLRTPKIWQAFRPGFLVFLAVMVVLGATLSRMAQGSYPSMMAMVILDFSLATALLGSSHVFWQQQVPGK
jgi:hypothetical protein